MSAFAISSGQPVQQHPSPLDALASELGAVAGQIERETSLRLAAALSDLKRGEADRELRFSKLERLVEDRVASLKDGTPGERGPEGPAGPRGERGDRGDQGERGEVGPQGEIGPNGERGEVGPLGPQGERGLQGEAGAKGESGAEGERGEAGERGETGPVGPQGERGLPGEVGERGEPGPHGERGPAGERGEPGELGPQGLQGETGPSGERGEAGSQGERGLQGEQGPVGALPIARAWVDRVHYESQVVTHAGALYQAARDTAKEPPHADWNCLAAAGRDGRSFAIQGTFKSDGEYRELDVVSLNGASFAARRDNPGPCPGDGWQLIAMQGKRGAPGERGASGEKGQRGETGPAAVEVAINDEAVLTIRSADGSTASCDLYPLLSKLQR